jgi:hypothetical protein
MATSHYATWAPCIKSRGAGRRSLAGIAPRAAACDCPHRWREHRHFQHGTQRDGTKNRQRSGASTRVECAVLTTGVRVETTRASPACDVGDTTREMLGHPRARGHHDVRTTMVYTHALNRGGLGVRSPARDEPLPDAPCCVLGCGRLWLQTLQRLGGWEHTRPRARQTALKGRYVEPAAAR